MRMVKSAKTFFVSLFILLTALEAWAGVSFVVWQAETNSPRIVVPKREGESPSEALGRYFRSLKENEELSRLLPPNFNFKPTGNIREFDELPKNSKTLVALIANRFEDLLPKGSRVRMNVRSFVAAGGDVYVIGLAADSGLSQNEAEEFREKIARSVDLLVAMGGADISPELYGERQSHAVNVNLARDRSEFELIQRFKKEARGVFFGICRGHQMGAIVDGHKLYQDISKDGIGDTNEHVNAEGRSIIESQRWHHIQINDSLLYRFLKAEIKVVNSVHHQAVRLNPEAASSAVAEYNGIVEALQMKNGLGLSVQFHPEISEYAENAAFARDGFRILRGIVTYARMKRMRPNRCSALFAGGN